MLHGLGRHAQLARALSMAADKVAQQAQRLKDRWKTRRRINGNGRAAGAGDGAAAAAPEAGARVIRARRSAVKPMRLEDAMLTLTEGRDSFLVFRDAGSDGVSILYRRQDGNFGLIEPEL
jgi:putative sigma-54 modulation protein